MSLHVASLNSGSNGNCYYIGNDTDAVLIDAGISARETDRRMQRLGLQMDKVRALFVSHEHSDHITGVAGLSKKYSLPVYISPATLAASRLPLIPELVRHLSTTSLVTIGNLAVTSFNKRHDASDPCSFVVSHQQVNVGVFTDIGRVCDTVKHHFANCHCVFLESNYCPDMLMKGKYPWFLKKRISDGYGHLSNQEALALFTQNRNNHLSHLILSHLSKNNNRPELVESLFTGHAGSTQIIVASRYEASSVYCIEGPGAASAKLLKPATARQLSLF